MFNFPSPSKYSSQHSVTSSSRRQQRFTPNAKTPSKLFSTPGKTSKSAPDIFTLTHIAHYALDRLLSNENTSEEMKQGWKDAVHTILNPKRKAIKASLIRLNSELLQTTHEKAAAAIAYFTAQQIFSERLLAFEDRWMDTVIEITEVLVRSSTVYKSEFPEIFVQRIVFDKINIQLYGNSRGAGLVALFTGKTTATLNEVVKKIKQLRIAREQRWQKIIKQLQDHPLERKDRQDIQQYTSALYHQRDEIIGNEIENYTKGWNENTEFRFFSREEIESQKNALRHYFEYLFEKHQLVEKFVRKKNIEEISNQSTFLPVTPHDYADYHLEQQVVHFEEQTRLNRDKENQEIISRNKKLSRSTSKDKKGELAVATEQDIARDVDILRYVLQQGLVSLTRSLSSDLSLEELRKQLAQRQEVFNEVDDRRFAIQCDLVETTVYLAANEQGIFELSPVRNAVLDTPAKDKLMAQDVDIAWIDANDNSLLSKAIQTKDIELIQSIFIYAEHKRFSKNEMLLQALKVLVEKSDFIGFLYLAAQGDLLSKEFRDYIRNIRMMSRDFNIGQASFDEFFDEYHQVKINVDALKEISNQAFALLVKHAADVHWPVMHAEIKRRYFTDTTAANVRLPAAIWRKLREKQREGEQFEKLTDYFADAITHVISAYQKSPQHYATKIDNILHVLHESVPEGKTLQQQALSIAHVFSQNNSTMAVERSHSLPVPCTATQRVFRYQSKRLQSLENSQETAPILNLNSSSLPPIVQNPCESVPISAKDLQVALEKTAGSSEEQEKRYNRAVIAKNIFKDVLSYLKKNKPDHDKKLPILNDLIKSYESGELNANQFIEKINAQIQLGSPTAGDEHKLGTPVPSCWAATFGYNRTSRLLRKALQKHATLLYKYEASRGV